MTKPWFRYSRREGLTAWPVSVEGWYATTACLAVVLAPLLLLSWVLPSGLIKVAAIVAYAALSPPIVVHRLLKLVVAKGYES